MTDVTARATLTQPAHGELRMDAATQPPALRDALPRRLMIVATSYDSYAVLYGCQSVRCVCNVCTTVCTLWARVRNGPACSAVVLSVVD